MTVCSSLQTACRSTLVNSKGESKSPRVLTCFSHHYLELSVRMIDESNLSLFIIIFVGY